ncbi:MAG: hypothetical protein E7214_05150 [Clostridium sp.]|nr:hypothetical protein [Clostridium sp.]
MRVIILEKNTLDAFVALEDGTIASIPLKLISNSNVGESAHLSIDNVICSRNRIPSNLVDFF